MIKKLSLTLLLALLILPDLQAQSGTNSPLSIFGIGEIEYRDFGRTTGMGSVGIGLQSENFLNRSNPAALSGIDTLRFVVDVSAVIKFSEFITSTDNARTNNFNFKNIAAGVRLSNRWTSSVGLSPFSNVGYSIRNSQPREGSVDAQGELFFTGSGGVNKFYWANAVELFRGFSLGVTSSYLFGNITHTQESNVSNRTETHNINKLNFDFGVQYSHFFGGHTRVTVGGIYGYESKMDIQQNVTLSSHNVILQNRRLPDQILYLPEYYGVGFSITHNRNNPEWVFAADYKFQNWSTNRLQHKELTFADSHIYSAGLQLTPNTRRPERLSQVMRFQLGASYSRSYLRVHGYQLEDYSVSMGVGIPFGLAYVNISAIVGESGTGQRGGITERYFMLSVGMSLVDRWFSRWQWD